MGKTGVWLSSIVAALVVIGGVSVMGFDGTSGGFTWLDEPAGAERADFDTEVAMTFCDITAMRRMKFADSFSGGKWETAFDRTTGIASITRHFNAQSGDGGTRKHTYRCIVNTFTNLVSNFQIADGHL